MCGIPTQMAIHHNVVSKPQLRYILLNSTISR
nr:MAG TPA: hypothetical protein [Caudoviricetes sp.]